MRRCGAISSASSVPSSAPRTCQPTTITPRHPGEGDQRDLPQGVDVRGPLGRGTRAGRLLHTQTARRAARRLPGSQWRHPSLLDSVPTSRFGDHGAGGGVDVLHGEGSGYWRRLVSAAKSLTWDASGPGDRSEWLSSNTECARGIFPLLKVQWKGKNGTGYVQRTNS